MSGLTWVGVALAGGLGAVARVACEGLAGSRWRSRVPLGTLAVNVVGSFCLGLLTGLPVAGGVVLVLGAGLLGSFTTFSTWMVQSARLLDEGRRSAAAADVGLSLVLGLAAAALGWALGTLVS